jgi:hypothetical protein
MRDYRHLTVGRSPAGPRVGGPGWAWEPALGSSPGGEYGGVG